ncbi:MAG: TolC family protein [Thermodesulfobacteriota bacterium]
MDSLPAPAHGQRSLWLWTCLVTLLGLILLQPRPAAAGPVDPGLAALVAEALAANPELAAAETRWRASLHRVVPAGTLPDPMLSFALDDYPSSTFSSGETSMAGQLVRLSQSLPFPGKLAAKAEAASKETRWYQGLYDDARLGLARQVKEAWYDLVLQEQSLLVVDRMVLLADTVIAQAESQYRVGRAGQARVVEAQMSRTELLEQRIGLVQMRDSALAALNALRNQPPDTVVATPAALAEPELPGSLGDLQAAGERRPLLAAYQGAIDSLEAMRRQAELDRLPDFSVGLGYRFRDPSPMDDGRDTVSAEIGLTVPIFQERRSEAIAEAEANLTRARQELADARNRVRLGIHDAYLQVERSRQLLALYRAGLVIQARHALDAALAELRVGGGDLGMVLAGLRGLYRLELEVQRLLAEEGKAVARLEAEAGVTPEVGGDL